MADIKKKVAPDAFIWELDNGKFAVYDYSTRNKEDACLAEFKTLEEAEGWCKNYFKGGTENV
mgnify:CR=1 FL=1